LVYAAGDSAATRGPKLSPVAGLEGRIAARNMIEGNVEKPDYSVVPAVVFTLPPVASVGLDETSATEMGIEFNRKFQDTSGWYSSQRIGHKHTAHKVLIETGSNKIIGAHLVGPNAEEIINFYALAIKHGITADDIKAVPWAFPSVSNDVKDML
jgi:glutathione reductase (NADPH)